MSLLIHFVYYLSVASENMRKHSQIERGSSKRRKRIEKMISSYRAHVIHGNLKLIKYVLCMYTFILSLACQLKIQYYFHH